MAAIDPAKLLDQHRRAAAAAVAELQPPPWNAPWAPSSASGALADRQVMPVRVVAVHEADESGNEQGPYLEVVCQAITLPRAASAFSLMYGAWPDRWLEIYSDLDGAPATAPYARLADWFAANDVILAGGFAVEVVAAGVEWAVTDGDTSYAVEMAGVGAEATLTAAVPAVEEITYTDDGAPFTAWPNPTVMRSLKGDAAFTLAKFHAPDDYYWAFLAGTGWVVGDAINDRKFALVKKCSGQGSYMFVQEWIWVAHALYCVGDEFQVRTHSGCDADDYSASDFFLAFRHRDTWTLGLPRKHGVTGSWVVFTRFYFQWWPYATSMDYWSKRLWFEDGHLVDVTVEHP
ncbi:MAG: hypothetical protein KAV00_01010 [Phycisphaerae bacterium]|nr:hypothetical protein [Phycisphaerae bacterium]